MFADRFDAVSVFGKFVQTIKHRLLEDIGGFKDTVGNESLLKVLKTILRRVQLRTVWWQMKKPTIAGSLQFLGFLPTRFVQYDQFVNALQKRGTNLL